MGQKTLAKKNLLCVLPTTPTLHMSFLLDVFTSILAPGRALWALTLGTTSIEMVNDDKLSNCYRTGSPVLQELPINIHYVTSWPSTGVDASTQLCGRWCQSQTTAVVSAEALCCRASKSVVCVKAGKCQGPSCGSDLIRFETCQDAACVQMSGEPGVNWRKLSGADDYPKKLIFLIKKDSARQCS